MLPVRSVLVKQKICEKNQIRYFGWFSNNVKSDIWIQELLQKKNECFFSLVFCLCFMIYVLFSFLFCCFLQGFRHYVSNDQLNKKLVFFGRCILTFFCNFQGQKMLAVAEEAESRVCVVLREFFHHIDEKAKVLPSKKVVEEVFFVQGYLERPNEG